MQPPKISAQVGNKRAVPAPLRCPLHGTPLAAGGGVLSCTQGHAFREREGWFDLLERPPDRDPYSSPLGWAYDWGANSRALARLTGLVTLGFDTARMYDLMGEGLRSRPGEVILDVPVGGGTAYGEGAPQLKGLLIGVDLSAGMLRRAAARRAAQRLQRRILLLRADARRLPLEDASVTRVMCFNGLHVMPEKLAVLREFRRVLKPGGRLLGTVLAADAPAVSIDFFAGERLLPFFTPPTRRSLARQVRAAGFRTWRTELTGRVLFFAGE